MPRGYWIAHVAVEDPQAYRAYVETARPAFERYGAKFLVRGGAGEEVEGALGRERHVLIEFPSLATARDCWLSEDYQRARAHRLPVSTGTIVLVEGVEDPPAPREASAEAPGYWLGHVHVTDPAGYARYREANAAPFAEHGARFLARGGPCEEMEGALGRERHVVIAFPSFARAKECYASTGYGAARALREGAGETTLVVVEGLA